MGLFDDALKDSESLFRDEIALDSDFQPPKISFRENENQYIAECIKPLLKKRSGKNLFVTGSPGIGKTVATKLVLLELEQKGLDEDIYSLYVNCWKKDTAHKIVLEICNQLGYRFILNKTTEQLITEVSKLLNKKSVVLVLDEIDKLDKEATSVLYSLLEDIYRKTIILITNSKDFLSEIDQRIFSRLVPETLEFKPYNFDETKEILRERIEYAFVPKIFSSEALETIAKKTFELGDIRAGLYFLKEAGNVAERGLKRSIDIGDAHEALSKLSEFKDKEESEFGDEENKLLEFIKNNSGKTAKEIHQVYNKELAYRTFSRYLERLEKSRAISIKRENFGESRNRVVFFGSKSLKGF